VKAALHFPSFDEYFAKCAYFTDPLYLLPYIYNLPTSPHLGVLLTITELVNNFTNNINVHLLTGRHRDAAGGLMFC